MSNITRHSAGTVIAGSAAGGQFAANNKTEADGSALAPQVVAVTAPIDPDRPWIPGIRQEMGSTEAERVSQQQLQELVDDLGLSHGNAEVEVDGDEVTISVEAYNHATVRAAEAEQAVADGKSLTDVKAALAQDLKDFNANDEFEELWSPEFGQHNGFTASQFMDGLRADEQHFRDTARKLRGQVRTEQMMASLTPEQVELARAEFEDETALHYGKGELDPYDTTRGEGGYEERFRVFLHREAENGVTW